MIATPLHCPVLNRASGAGKAPAGAIISPDPGRASRASPVGQPVCPARRAAGVPRFPFPTANMAHRDAVGRGVHSIAYI